MFVEGGEVRLRYSELDAVVGGYATALVQRGAKPGDRILVKAEKSIESALLYLASLRAGLVYVPLNTAYTAAELTYFIEDAEPALIFAEGRLSLAELDPEPAAFETVPRGPDDLAAILYTSGTTGRSKGAMLSHDNLASNALVLKDYWRWQAGDVLIHALPIYHVHGLFVALHGALLNGSTMLWHKGFDADAVLADMGARDDPDGRPDLLRPPRRASGPDAGRCGEHAALHQRLRAPAGSTFAEFEAKTGHRILERYGMTEAGMICSNPYEGERIPGTVGYPLPGVEARHPRRSARDTRAEPVQGLLAQSGEDRGGDAPRRLVRHRRYRDHGG